MNGETVKSIRRQLDVLDEYIDRGDRSSALSCAEYIISLAPKEAIGYIAKAQAMLCGSETTQYADLFPPLKKAAKCSRSAELAPELKKLLDLGSGEYKVTLLMHGCSAKNYDVVKALVDLGADIHIKNTMGGTALWYVCFKPLPAEKRTGGIKIVRLLLDLGAETNISNANGVALLNDTTDETIARMIRTHRPETKAGSASADGAKAAKEAAKSFDAQDVGVYIGGGIGIAIGVIFDTFLLGALITVILGFAGGYMGKCIQERSFKAILKGIAVFVVIGALCGLMLHACSGGGKEATRICPNCHTEMPASAVSGGQCTRCDGNDWG